MKTRLVKWTALFVVAAFIVSPIAGYAGPPIWEDQFASEELDPTWFWVNENPDRWSLTAEAGYMRIYASPTATGGENLLLKSGVAGNFAIETRVLFEPIQNFQIAGLVIYQDESNYLQLGRAFCDVEEACVGNGIYFDHIAGGELEGGNFATPTDASGEVYLRMELRGRQVSAFYSENGENWSELGQHELRVGFNANAVGLTSAQDFWMEDDPIAADFDYFSYSGHSRSNSPFSGHWEATDSDGSDLGLAIGGPVEGSFNITMTDNYISFCGGGPGSITGSGQLNAENSRLLEAILHLQCLTNEDSLDFGYSWWYDPLTDTLLGVDEFGTAIPWNRPGRPEPVAPKGLIINPLGTDGSDFSVRPSDEILLRWGWGACTAGQVQAFVSAVDVATSLDGQRIEGEWSTPEEAPQLAGYCTGNGRLGWVTNWEYLLGNLEPGAHTLHTTVTITHPVTDGFDSDGDGHPDRYSGVLIEDAEITIYVVMPIVVASATGDWMWTSDFAPWSEISAIVYESQEAMLSEEPPIWSGTADTNEDGFASLAFEGLDVAPGNYLTVSDGITQKELLFEDFTIDTFDFDLGVIAGTAPAETVVTVVASISPDAEDQKTIAAPSGGDGQWSADFFTAFGITFTPEWLPWSFAQIYDEDHDANEAVSPPAMGLRVNYAHDWVESFYEAGHWVELTATASDGTTVKGTASAYTESKDYWGGESGFTTNETGWAGGITPDLQPGDWVFASVDNGVEAQVQIGEIQGAVDIGGDSVSGTIQASWIEVPVEVECLDWGSGGDTGNQPGGTISPDGSESFYCEWDSSVWDIQPWQDVGVGYATPDGHWVANAFRGEFWVAMWTYDYTGLWAEGDHSYYMQWEYTLPAPGGGQVMDPVYFSVSSMGSTYDGFALLYSRAALTPLVWTGDTCEVATSIHPDQTTRFGWGWVNDYSMTYEEAADHFSSFAVQVFWDGELSGSAVMDQGDLVPWYGPGTSDDYRCSLTGH